MSFWSGEKLSTKISAEKLIEPYNPHMIDCASYQLTLGSEVYVSPTDKSKDAQSATIQQLSDKDGIAIPSGQFAFLITEEQVKVPRNAIAFISIRARIKFRGLVNVSGFHVDPGYHGRLVFSVFNASPATIHLRRGESCFLIWYADLDQESERVKKLPGFLNIPSEIVNPIAGEVKSLAGLSNRLDIIENEQALLKSIATIALTILIGIFLLLLKFVPVPDSIIDRIFNADQKQSSTSIHDPTINAEQKTIRQAPR